MNTSKLNEIRQGNPETMTALLEEVAPVIVAVAARFHLDPGGILQEVSIHLLRDPGRTARLFEEGKLKSWCHVVSRNIAMHELRRMDKDCLPNVLTDDDRVRKSAFVEPLDPQQLLENDEMLEQLRQLLSSLDEVDQQIITLHYVEGMRFDEIASLLSLKPDRVRQKAYRAIAELRYSVKRRVER